MPAGRKPSVRYWASRGTWTDANGKIQHGSYCVTLNGQQHVLAVGPDDAGNDLKGPTYLKALSVFRDLLALENAGNAKDLNSCRVVCEHYFRSLKENAKPLTLAARQADLADFCKTEMGDWPVKNLTPFAVQEWIRDMRTPRQVPTRMKNEKTRTQTFRWGDGRARRVVHSLKAAFNWAREQGLITVRPLDGLKAPPSRSRGRDCIVSPEDHTTILTKTRGQLREFVICLEATGCRPGELLMATAADWKDDLGALVFYKEASRKEGEARHKTSGKGKNRYIYFHGESLRIMRERVRRYPRGPLWRDRGGSEGRWAGRAVVDAFTKLRKRVGMANLSAYSYRHTYATRWLESGRSIDDLAAALGNSAAVIRKHYAHLCDNVDRMRALTEGFTSERTETPPRVLPFGEATG
jgi:integrase